MPSNPRLSPDEMSGALIGALMIVGDPHLAKPDASLMLSRALIQLREDHAQLRREYDAMYVKLVDAQGKSGSPPHSQEGA